MKPRYSTFLMNEAEEMEASGGGMTDMMNDFFSEAPDGVMPEKSLEDIDSEPKEAVKAPEAAQEEEEPPLGDEAPEKKPDAAEGDSEESDDEDEFPDLGSDDTADDQAEEFNEEAFDKETQALLKSIEEKGHPGDVYKKLRAELKEAKLSQGVKQVSPDDIPEYVELKKEVEELKSIKDEVEGLRQQRDELLKVADEAAIEVLPEFVKNVKEPLATMDQDLNAIATATGVEKAALLAVIREKDVAKQDKMIGELEESLSRRALSRLERIIEDYPKVIETRDRMYENKSAEIAKSRENQELESKKKSEAQIQEFHAHTKEAFTRYAKSIPGFIDSTGNLSQMAQTEMKKAMAINIHDLSTGDVAFLAFAARAIGPMREEIRRLQGSSGAPKQPSSKPAKINDPGSAKPKKSEEDGPESFMKAMEGKNFTFDNNFAGASGY